MFGHFNNNQIRRFILAFGSFFDDIYVVRADIVGVEKQSIRVPLEYGPKEKFLLHLIQDPDFLQSTAITVPRLAYEMTGITYDGNRKFNTLNQLKFPSLEQGKLARTWVGVPYNINFELVALVKFQSDGFQIVEQILPFFTPDLTFAVKTLPGLGVVDTVPLTLNSVSSTDNYEGDFEKRRVILWTFGFAMKVYFYGPTRTQGRIEEVQVDLYNVPYGNGLAAPPYYFETQAGDLLTNQDGTLLPTQNTSNTYLTTGLVERVTVVPDPLDQDPTGNVTARTTITEYDGGIKRSRTMTDEELG